MSSIVQAKAEAQKLIKRYNKLQEEAKAADTTDEAARKAAEAEKLVSQISALQTAITKLQARDRDGKTASNKSPTAQRKPQQPAASSSQTSGGGMSNAMQDELKRAEAEKLALESRIGRIENAQRKTREQIEQLSRAKRELARLKTQAEQNARERRASDEKLQQELNRRIKAKEDEHLRLKQELEAARSQAQKDAELLRVQRDAARAMMEKQQQLEKERQFKRRRGGNGLLIGISIGIVMALILIGLTIFTPFLDEYLVGLKGERFNQPSQQNIETAQEEPEKPEPPPEEPKKAEEDKPIPVKPLAVYRDRLKRGGAGPVMLKLPGGKFKMGNKPSSPHQDERPQIEVTLQSFSISRFEITFDEYDLFASNTGRNLPNDKGWGRGQRPVINVSWNDAMDYTKWLTEQTGKQYRLPSEREWEYAAKAGTQTDYWWGYKLEQGKANCGACGSQWDGKKTAPIGSFDSNAFGLHDVIGNVMEWTISCFHASYQGAPAYGQIWEGGNCSRRIVRSSSYRTYKNSLRVTKRHDYNPRTRMDTLGFRIVRVN